ncbi:TPA: resolvase [Klebsiella pneumoniae]|nr:resolvase [Klebsiella pneumoniae]HBY2480631.1 resolvase [Klebsiella pneumoniae]
MFWNPWGVRRHAHLALVHTSIEHSRDWCRSLLILNCQELAAQQPLRPINWCSRLLKMTLHPLFSWRHHVAKVGRK